jgi:hypothetical protein
MHTQVIFLYIYANSTLLVSMVADLSHIIFSLREAPYESTKIRQSSHFSPGALHSESTTKWLHCRIFAFSPGTREAKTKHFVEFSCPFLTRKMEVRQNDHFVVCSCFSLRKKYDMEQINHHTLHYLCKLKVSHKYS